MRVASLLIGLAAVAGCASDVQPAAGATDLTVHVGIYGGPELPDGGMAASNTPQQDARITVTDTSGRAWTARTDRHGMASFAVPAGHYSVRAPCGPVRPVPVTVRLGHTTRVHVRCDVP